VNHLKLFESFSTSGPSSNWPRKKSYRGVRILDILDPKDSEDMKKIEAYIKLAHSKRNWFRDSFDFSGNFTPKISGVEFAEVLMPKGVKEILAFDDFDNTDSDDKDQGIISAESLDGKWSFWVPATSSGEVEWDELYFDRLTSRSGLR
jgi:hypothetical protein